MPPPAPTRPDIGAAAATAGLWRREHALARRCLLLVAAAGAAATPALAGVAAEAKPEAFWHLGSARELLSQLMFGLGVGCIAWSLRRILRQHGTRAPR